MTRVLPTVFADQQIRPVDHYGRVAAQRPAPGGARRRRAIGPTVVVLTPGVFNSAYFEHVFLASQMGVELVEGRDLVVDDHVVSMRTTQGLQRVDVIYRRIDDDFLDPVVVPRRLDARRARAAWPRPGPATSPSPTRSATASPTTRPSTPTCPTSSATTSARSRSSPTCPTYLLWDEDQRAEVLDRLDQLVVKPVAEAGGYGIVIGPAASRRGARGRAAATSRPTPATTSPRRSCRCRGTRRWCDDHLEGRHIDLRPFVLSGDDIEVIPGGLTRVAMRQGLAGRELVARAAARRTPGCCAARGARADGRRQSGRRDDDADHVDRGAVLMLARDAESLFWTGRYLERAEDTARLLDVTYHGMLETTPAEEAQAWRDVLAAVRLDARVRRHEARRSAPRPCRSSSCSTPRTPARSCSAVEQARENARTVREQLSTELWESLNSFCLELRARNLRADLEFQPHELYGMVRRQCQTVAGVAAETMARDEGWRFFVLGLEPRAGRDGLPAAVGALPPAVAVGVPPVDGHAALGVGARGLPAHLPGVDGPGRRGRVPAAVAHVPPQRPVLAAHRRERPRPASLPTAS